MTVTTLPHWFTIPAAAEQVGVSRMTIRRAIDRGEIRTRRIVSLVRILDDELARWMRHGPPA